MLVKSSAHIVSLIFKVLWILKILNSNNSVKASISPWSEVSLEILTSPFCLRTAITHREVEKYWFSHPHDDSEAAFSVLPSAWHLEILQETPGERVAEKEKEEWGTGEEKKKRKQKKEEGERQRKKGEWITTSGVDRGSEIEQPYIAFALRRLSLWKMEIKDHFHDGSCSKYYCWNPPGKVAVLWDVHGKLLSIC